MDTARHCATCGAELVRQQRYKTNGKPNGLEPMAHFLERKTCGRQCQTRGGKPQWPRDHKVALRALYPYFPAPFIARALGYSHKQVLRMAEAEGLRKTARGRTNAAKHAQRNRRAA